MLRLLTEGSDQKAIEVAVADSASAHTLVALLAYASWPHVAQRSLN